MARHAASHQRAAPEPLDLDPEMSLALREKGWNSVPYPGVPGNIPGQAGQGSEQPDLVEDVPAHCEGSWTRRPLKISSNPEYSMIL